MHKSLIIALTLAASSAAHATPGSDAINARNKASSIASKLIGDCTKATEGLGAIMNNADKGVKYKFNPDTIEGQMGIDAYNFALKNPEEADRQEYINDALSTCVSVSSQKLRQSLNKLQ